MAVLEVVDTVVELADETQLELEVMNLVVFLIDLLVLVLRKFRRNTRIRIDTYALI